MALAISAEGYFCRALALISDTLGVILSFFFFLSFFLGFSSLFSSPRSPISLQLSQNVAGVTFLALGNGAPDLFSSFSAISQEAAELSLGAILGAGIFVNTVVVGSICLITPFQLTRRPFLRDVSFYAVGISAVWIFVSDHAVSLWEAALLVVWYVIYVSVVIVGRRVYQSRKKQARREAALSSGVLPPADGANTEDEPLLKERKGYSYNVLPSTGGINTSEEDLSGPPPLFSSSFVNAISPDTARANPSSNTTAPTPAGPRPVTWASPAGFPASSLPALKGQQLLRTSSASPSVSNSTSEDLAGERSGTLTRTSSSGRRTHKRTKSLEGQFHYSSSSASMLTGAKPPGQDDSVASVQQAKPEDRRHSFSGMGPSEQDLQQPMDGAILTPALKARIAG